MPEGLYNPIAIIKNVITGSYIENKYGRNPDIDIVAAEDVWDGGGNYTGFPLGAAETISVVSSSVLDTAAGTGARTVLLEGVDALYGLQTETLTLNGTTPVISISAFLRVHRVTVITAGTGQVNAGTITVKHSVTVANIFAVMAIGLSRSQVSAYTIPLGYTGYIINYSASCSDTGNTRIELAFKVRTFANVIQLVRPFIITAGATITIPLFGAIVLPEMSDVIVRVLSTTSDNAVVSASYDLLVAKNTVP